MEVILAYMLSIFSSHEISMLIWITLHGTALHCTALNWFDTFKTRLCVTATVHPSLPRFLISLLLLTIPNLFFFVFFPNFVHLFTRHLIVFHVLSLRQVVWCSVVWFLHHCVIALSSFSLLLTPILSHRIASHLLSFFFTFQYQFFRAKMEGCTWSWILWEHLRHSVHHRKEEETRTKKEKR